MNDDRRGPNGERIVWMILIAAILITIVAYMMTTLDPSVVCSNNQPC